MKISLTDAAYEYLKTVNGAFPFIELYAIAADKAGLSEDMRKKKKNSFYSQLSLDSRFTQQAGNTWDLKERHSYEETRITVEEIDTDDDENEDEILSEDAEEEDGEDNSPVYPVADSMEEY